jgi:hypothetical protein
MGINTFNDVQKTKAIVVEDVILYHNYLNVAIFSILSPFGICHGEAS